jgi:hypothetical protein
VLAMLGSDGGSTPGQRARTETVGERCEIGCDRGRGRRQRRCASEATSGHERRPVARIEPQCFGRRRAQRPRRGRRDIDSCAVYGRLVCVGVHAPFLAVTIGLAGVAGLREQPNDSRPLFRFGQA